MATLYDRALALYQKKQYKEAIEVHPRVRGPQSSPSTSAICRIRAWVSKNAQSIPLSHPALTPRAL